MPSRRRVPPLPVAELISHPNYIAMPCAGVGIVFRLIIHYWVTECAALPSAERELVAIARAHRATWRRHRLSVMVILADVLPILYRAHVHRLARRQNLLLASQAGVASRERSRVLRSHTARAEPLPLYAMDIAPKRRPPSPPRNANQGRKWYVDR